MCKYNSFCYISMYNTCGSGIRPAQQNSTCAARTRVSEASRGFEPDTSMDRLKPCVCICAYTYMCMRVFEASRGFKTRYLDGEGEDTTFLYDVYTCVCVRVHI